MHRICNPISLISLLSSIRASSGRAWYGRGLQSRLGDRKSALRHLSSFRSDGRIGAMEPVDLLGDISHLRLSEGSSDNDSSLSAVSTTPPLSPDWPGDPAEGEGGAAFEGPTSDVRRETYEAWGTRRTGRCVGWDAVKGRGVILDERWGAHAGPSTFERFSSSCPTLICSQSRPMPTSSTPLEKSVSAR